MGNLWSERNEIKAFFLFSSDHKYVLTGAFCFFILFHLLAQLFVAFCWTVPFIQPYQPTFHLHVITKMKSHYCYLSWVGIISAHVIFFFLSCNVKMNHFYKNEFNQWRPHKVRSYRSLGKARGRNNEIYTNQTSIPGSLIKKWSSTNPYKRVLVSVNKQIKAIFRQLRDTPVSEQP